MILKIFIYIATIIAVITLATIAYSHFLLSKGTNQLMPHASNTKTLSTETQAITQTVFYENTHHNLDGSFSNTDKTLAKSASIYSVLFRFVTQSKKHSTPTHPIPIHSLSTNQLNQLQTDTVIRLGHSSIFIQLNGQKWLIDPVFSDRASPLSFIGPKRFHQPPITLDLLPPLDGILISHNHYDHLDKASIKALIHKTPLFVVPIGVNQTLSQWQVPRQKIVTLDWWQSVKLNGLEITATPAQHFSGRGLFDKNKSLWASYVISSPKTRLFFSGDSGYFDGFKRIGDHYGPFDMTLIEVGAYDQQWPNNHMTPEQSLQAHIDLKGAALLPIHNGTFNLAFHPWYEPFERITTLAEKADIPILTPIMGQVLTVNDLPQTHPWWRDVQSP
ncbi:MBL fold metallo-hydrolase [uncultured Shewanella sp.]|uniref:MBL fold metallo-hydrolase n=1 Tax=uncultured Shewanella sp. TaxID=173975 RepID=UPI002623C640|nr:MBL fold metallo-hydrolase [uncultured Shewanella sp.]